MDAPLALYRRYRPETFAEVIGQDHVTAPLRNALTNNKVHHAYLFSGPRGCGKTTSARILARALNCEQFPTDEPCGECDSCVALARGGAGSVDVIEIDAASHGGVDDARDLRERAFFAPVASRFKVYIVDEAHMVSTQGFNALLKLVEEPPPHLKFIFATTEPDKVIGTIKSRTHHYPFRLVPPKLLGDYLATLCEREGVTVEPAVFPLVVRAGAGSVRDSLSVLDQLIGGAGPDGVTYGLAAALLGYTPASLLDEVVDAFSAGDGGSVFGVVDKVIETGQDPRRFGEDLLRRLRDLVIVAAVPDAPAKGIIDVAEDQAERLVAQAARFGKAELVRAADIVGQGLTDMRGATAPRLLLELICARVLLPGADDSAEGVHARIDRIERRFAMGGVQVSGQAAPAAGGTTQSAPASATGSEPSQSGGVATPPQGGPTTATTTGASGAVASAGATEGAETAEPSAAPGEMTVVDVRRLWPDILEGVKKLRRFTWIMLSQNAHVSAFDGKILTVGLVNAGARDRFVSSGSDEILRQALIDLLGVDWQIEAIVDIGQGSGGSGSSGPSAVGEGSSAGPAPGVGRPAESPPAQGDSPSAATTSQSSRPETSTSMPDDDRADQTGDPSTLEGGSVEPPPSSTPSISTTVSLAPDGGAPGAPGGIGASGGHDPDAHATPDDPDIESADHDQLLARELGAQVIEEISND